MCPSLSGKSKLTFEVGCDTGGEFHVRISKNSGTGYFSKAWVSWDRLHRLLEKNGAKPVTSHTLSPLSLGHSVNTAGFLLAGLKHEGLVQPMEDKPRCFQRLDAGAFLLGVQGLVDAPAASSKSARSKAGPAAKKARLPATSKKRKSA